MPLWSAVTVILIVGVGHGSERVGVSVGAPERDLA
jgi:hypothetical protein